MSAKAFVTVQNSFVDEVSAAFGFLVAEFGLDGPHAHHHLIPAVTYAKADQVHYRIALDTGDEAVVTTVTVSLPLTTVAFDLLELVEPLKVGRRSHVRSSAHTFHGLRTTLESQARTVRAMHPLLTEPGREELLAGLSDP